MSEEIVFCKKSDLDGTPRAHKQVTRPTRYEKPSKKQPFQRTPKKRVSARTASRIKDTKVYEVERILGAILGEGAQWVLVKWKDWGEDYNTWEKVHKMTQARETVNQFYRQHQPTRLHPKVMTQEGEQHAELIYGPEDDYDFSYLKHGQVAK